MVNGTNAYAIMAAPRASGAEAIIISASWLSRTGEGDGTLNLRGVATVLSLAGYLKSELYIQNLQPVIEPSIQSTPCGRRTWSSSSVTATWTACKLSSQPTMVYRKQVRIRLLYPGCMLRYAKDLHAEALELSSGVVWTAINVDYPGHSFSHLGVFFGKLLVNDFERRVADSLQRV